MVENRCDRARPFVGAKSFLNVLTINRSRVLKVVASVWVVLLLTALVSGSTLANDRFNLGPIRQELNCKQLDNLIGKLIDLEFVLDEALDNPCDLDLSEWGDGLGNYQQEFNCFVKYATTGEALEYALKDFAKGALLGGNFLSAAKKTMGKLFWKSTQETVAAIGAITEQTENVAFYTYLRRFFDESGKEPRMTKDVQDFAIRHKSWLEDITGDSFKTYKLFFGGDYPQKGDLVAFLYVKKEVILHAIGSLHDSGKFPMAWIGEGQHWEKGEWKRFLEPYCYGRVFQMILDLDKLIWELKTIRQKKCAPKGIATPSWPEVPRRPISVPAVLPEPESPEPPILDIFEWIRRLAEALAEEDMRYYIRELAEEGYTLEDILLEEFLDWLESYAFTEEEFLYELELFMNYPPTSDAANRLTDYLETHPQDIQVVVDVFQEFWRDAFLGERLSEEYRVSRVEEKDPLMECVELLAKSTREEYKDEGNYAWYKLSYRDKKCEFFLAELEIYKDSPYVTTGHKRCARDLLQAARDLLQADWEKYCEACWDIFAR